MDSLKEKILEKLEHLPETKLQEVLDFVDFIEWRKVTRTEPSLSLASNGLSDESEAAWLETDLSNQGSYEPYEWQPGDLDEGLPVKYIPGKGLVVVEE